MKKLILILCAIACLGGAMGQSITSYDSITGVSIQIVTPTNRAEIDTQKLMLCKQVVAQVDDNLSQYDVFRLKYNTEIVEITLDKSGRLRKYFRESGYDAESDTIKAYYRPNGELVQIEYSSVSHCEGETAIYYIDRGAIIDYKIVFDCFCCEGHPLWTEEEVNERRPMIGSPLERQIGLRLDLADFVDAGAFFLKLPPRVD